MTNSKTTQCGIYELPMKLASFDTGYDVDTVNKLIEDFEQLGKVMYDKSTDEIAIHNWRKYNETSSPKVLACVRKEVVRVKSKILLGFMGYENNDDYTPANRSYRVSDKTREFILNRDNYKCTKCDSQSDLTIDHIYPRTLGGLSDIDNLRTLCRSCNSKRPLLGGPLKQEILASGYDYDKLKQTYQYPIGSHPQKEEEEEQKQEQEQEQGEVINEDVDIRNLFIKRWSRSYKNISEMQGAEKLVCDYGYEKVDNAFRIAGERDKTTIPYVRGILSKEAKDNEPKKRFGNSAIMNELYPEG